MATYNKILKGKVTFDVRNAPRFPRHTKLSRCMGFSSTEVWECTVDVQESGGFQFTPIPEEVRTYIRGLLEKDPNQVLPRTQPCFSHDH